MALIVYGDFNCPYSALASARVDVLIDAGELVDWRAVQHDASMPRHGVDVEGDVRAELTREVDEVRSLLRPDEPFDLRIPKVRPNTAEACRRFASDPSPEARRLWFDWAWARAGEPASYGEDAELAARWQREWDATEKKMVPMLVLPDGYVSRGLGALKRLADMIADAQAASDTRA